MMRVEIIGRDSFWQNAVLVEWEHQHPERVVIKEPAGSFLIERDWFDDLNRVASTCFSTVVRAPADPSRRSWFRHFFRSHSDVEP